METVTIHPAETNDLQALCGLYIWFHEFRIRGLPDRLRSLREAEQRDDSWIIEGLEKIMADGNAVILVAENSQNLVGLAHTLCGRTNQARLPFHANMVICRVSSC